MDKSHAHTITHILLQAVHMPKLCSPLWIRVAIKILQSPLCLCKRNWGCASLAITLTTPEFDFFILLNSARGKTEEKKTTKDKSTDPSAVQWVKGTVKRAYFNKTCQQGNHFRILELGHFLSLCLWPKCFIDTYQIMMSQRMMSCKGTICSKRNSTCMALFICEKALQRNYSSQMFGFCLH